jgi:hypothetical protein
MDPQQKLLQDVKKFLEVYKVLSAEGKSQFEAQMAGSVKGEDEKTKKLYYALLQAAKDGKGIEGAIREMEKASGVSLDQS